MYKFFNYRSKKLNVLIYLYIITSIFPYISIVRFPMDTAPYAVIIIIAILFKDLFLTKSEFISNIYLKKLDAWIIFSILSFSAIIALRFLILRDIDSFRVLGNYLSILLFYFYFSLFITKKESLKILFFQALTKLIFYGSIFYLIGTVLQLTSRLTGISFFFDLTNSLLSADISGRTSTNRGFNSFSPEPSYMGILGSLLISISSYLFSIGYFNKKYYFITLSNYIFVVILSASATALPFFSIALFSIVTVFTVRFRWFFYVLIFSLLFIFLSVSQFFTDLRFFQLLNSLSLNGLNDLQNDVSFLSRLASIINYSLPLMSGYNIFGQPLNEVDINYFLEIYNTLDIKGLARQILETGVIAEGGGIRTKSAIAQSLFLFGIFSLFFWISFFLRLNYFGNFFKNRFFIILLIFLGYLIQIPLGHPTFCLAVGVLLLRPFDRVSIIKYNIGTAQEMKLSKNFI